MLNKLYDNIGESNFGAIIIISVALMIFFGFAMTRITKKLRLPNVTAYIISGIIIGPAFLDLIPKKIILGTDFLSDENFSRETSAATYASNQPKVD